VDQIKIEVVELEILERFMKRGDDILLGMLVIPQLGSDPEVFPVHAIIHELFECRTDEMLVAVNSRAIKVPVTEMSGFQHRFRDRFTSDRVGAKRAEANCGHACAGR